MRQLIRVVAAILLIAAGILFLLQNLGILGGSVALLWALLFGAGGVVFLSVFLTNRANWWPVVPGFALLGIAGLIAMGELAPGFEEAWGGALFLGGIALAFWIVYFTNRENWWALIPGGVLLTLALVAGLSSVFEDIELGGVFFLGLGLTFALLSFLRTPGGRLKWALIPAGVLLAMGLAITAATESLLQYLWPAALILGGLYLIVRTFSSRRGG
jgi:hypothetical protein